jgi:hypothetical protein
MGPCNSRSEGMGMNKKDSNTMPNLHPVSRNKKGILFTVTAIVLSVVIVLSFALYSEQRLKEKMSTIETRVVTMNNFIKDIEKDLQKGIYISSFRAFLSMSQYIASNGTFIDNVEQTFNELLFNGTIDNQQVSLMEGSTFTDWVNKIQSEADKIDIIVNFTVNEAKSVQEDPWYITVSVGISMEVEDKKQTSSWDINKNLETNISIRGLEDPLYVINSYGRVTNTIRVSPFQHFVVGGDNENLLTHLNEPYYISTNMSPNFLMRFEGNLASSETGIESLVNLQEFVDQGLAVKDRSAVDYIYFGNQTTANCRINDTPLWFKLDSEHLATYEVGCST